MSRYIDADALKAFIRNQYFQCDMPEEWGNGVMWATSQINHYCNKVAPSIDIVRCKECKYKDNCEQEVLLSEMYGEIEDTAHITYCSYGEREGER